MFFEGISVSARIVYRAMVYTYANMIKRFINVLALYSYLAKTIWVKYGRVPMLKPHTEKIYKKLKHVITSQKHKIFLAYWKSALSDQIHCTQICLLCNGHTSSNTKNLAPCCHWLHKHHAYKQPSQKKPKRHHSRSSCRWEIHMCTCSPNLSILRNVIT